MPFITNFEAEQYMIIMISKNYFSFFTEILFVNFSLINQVSTTSENVYITDSENLDCDMQFFASSIGDGQS